MDPWENERSYLLESKDELGRAVYEGALIFHEIEFRARVNPQNSGKYLYRGRVSAISPADGFVVQVRGREAIRRLGGPRVTGPGEKKKRDKKLNLTSEVYIQSGACEKVKEAVLKTARNMYAKHATMLAGELQKSVRPGSITPGVAAELYAGDFIATNYKNVKEETAKKYTKKIKDAFAELPSLPMSEYKQTMVASFLGKQKIGKDTQRMISDFWEFLVLKNYVEGVNPFPPIKQKKLSPAKKQQRAQQLSELSLARQDSLYTHIMKKPINGGDCGVALLTWAKLPDEKKTLKWKDVIMDADRRDFVLIKYRRDDLAGATHNYIQPQTIQVARILWRQKEKLLLRYSEKELLEMPVISLQKNPKKAMQMNTLIQYAGTLLRAIGIEERFSQRRTRRKKPLCPERSCK